MIDFSKCAALKLILSCLRSASSTKVYAISGNIGLPNGGIIAKRRAVMLALGTHPTLYDGVIELTPFEWLTPIEKSLPQLQEALSMVKPQDLQIGNPALEPIRTSWLGIVNLFQTFEDLESVKDKPADIEAIRQVLAEDEATQNEEAVC